MERNTMHDLPSLSETKFGNRSELFGAGRQGLSFDALEERVVLSTTSVVKAAVATDVREQAATESKVEITLQEQKVDASVQEAQQVVDQVQIDPSGGVQTQDPLDAALGKEDPNSGEDQSPLDALPDKNAEVMDQALPTEVGTTEPQPTSLPGEGSDDLKEYFDVRGAGYAGDSTDSTDVKGGSGLDTDVEKTEIDWGAGDGSYYGIEIGGEDGKGTTTPEEMTGDGWDDFVEGVKAFFRMNEGEYPHEGMDQVDDPFAPKEEETPPPSGSGTTEDYGPDYTGPGSIEGFETEYAIKLNAKFNSNIDYGDQISGPVTGVVENTVADDQIDYGEGGMPQTHLPSEQLALSAKDGGDIDWGDGK